MKQLIAATIVICLGGVANTHAGSTSSILIAEDAVKEAQQLQHGGRTNKDGCHRNTKTGGYHCH